MNARRMSELFTNPSPHYRASFFLRWGAVLTAVAGLSHLLANLPAERASGGWMVYLPWSLWVWALLAVGFGFLWIGSAPGYPRLGFLVAAAYVGQAFSLLAILVPMIATYLPHELITAVRLVTLLLFAVQLHRVMPGSGGRLLAVVVAVQLVKVLLRNVGVLPLDHTPPLILADAVLLWAVAWAIHRVGRRARRGESRWRELHLLDEEMTLEDFNNPEHPWNRNMSAE